MVILPRPYRFRGYRERPLVSHPFHLLWNWGEILHPEIDELIMGSQDILPRTGHPTTACGGFHSSRIHWQSLSLPGSGLLVLNLDDTVLLITSQKGGEIYGSEDDPQCQHPIRVKARLHLGTCICQQPGDHHKEGEKQEGRDHHAGARDCNTPERQSQQGIVFLRISSPTGGTLTNTRNINQKGTEEVLKPSSKAARAALHSIWTALRGSMMDQTTLKKSLPG